MSVTPLRKSPSSSSRINPRVEQLQSSGIRAFFDLVLGKQDVISLGVGEPDFATPWHICEAGIHSLESGRTSYTSNSGLFELREEISLYLQKTTGAQYDPKGEIIVTVGGSEAIDIAFRTLLEPGDEAIVIDPSFVSYAPSVLLAGGNPVRVPTYAEEHFLPRLEDLENAVHAKTRAILFNYPNNPTGATLSKDKMEEIVQFVLHHDLIIISDEIYLPLTYAGEQLSFASRSELRDQLVLIHGFSKAWAMTGWRLGFTAGPRDILAGMEKIHQYAVMCSPTTAQYAAIEALRHGEEEVETMKKEYDRRRRFITQHFNRIGLTCFEPDGAFYVFPSIQVTGMTSQAFAERLLEEENVAVVPGPAFGACGEGYIRCSYATSLEEIREAIRRMESFVKRHAR